MKFPYLIPFLLASGLFFTTSAHGQWQPTDGPYEIIGVTDVSQYGSQMIASTACGTYTGSPSGGWTYRDNGSYNHLLVDSLLYFYSGGGWATVDLTNPSFHVQKNSNKATLAMASKDSLLFFGSYEGFMYSDDGGIHTYPFNTGLPMDTIAYSNSPVFYRLRVMDIVITANHMLIATERGIHRSDFTYSQWEETGWSSGFVSHLELIGSSFFAVSHDSIFRSMDDGQSWSYLYRAPSRVTSINGFQGDLYLTTQEHGILRSADNGRSWQSMNAGFNTGALWNGAWFTKTIDNKLFAGSIYQGLYEMQGSTWNQASVKGMYCNYPRGLESTGSAMIYAGQNSLFKKKDTGGWEELQPFPSRSFRYYSMKAEGNMVCAVADEITSGNLDSLVVMSSKDGGQTWKMLDTLPTVMHFYRPPRLFVLEGKIYLADSEKLFVSSDTGNTWQDMNLPLPMSFCSEGVYDLAMYQGDLHALTCRTSMIYRYKSGLWDAITAGLGGSGKAEKFIKRDSVLMTSSPTNLYRNVNGAFLWQQSGNGLPQQPVLDYVNTGDRTYITTLTAGVYYSEDHGETWHAYSNGLAGTYFHALDSYRDTLYLATGKGVYKHAVHPATFGIDDNSSPSAAFSLYPNPASSFVVIEQEAGRNGSYQLRDSSGRLLRSGSFTSGEKLKLEGIPSGVYILSANSDGLTQRQKLIVE